MNTLDPAVDFSSGFYKKYHRIVDYYLEISIGRLSQLMKWRPNGSILEVGCGTGDATMKYICPVLPENYAKYICSDYSKDMIKEAEKLFKGNPKVSCSILDIASELEECAKNQFDHIVSLECLMWVTDQAKAFQNLYDLLKPGGSCFLIFVCTASIWDVLLELSSRPKWRKFLPQPKKMYPFPYREDADPEKTVRELMESLGFVNVKIEMHLSHFMFQNKEEFLGFVKALPNPMGLMTQEEQDEYLKEAADVAFFNDNVIHESGFGGISGTQMMAYGEK